MKYSWVVFLMLAASLRADPLDNLSGVLAAVEANNPSLESLRAAARALDARAAAAAPWPAASLGAAREKTPAGERMSHWRVAQEVPFPGKRTQESRMLEHEAREADASVREASLALRAEARTLYAEIRRGEAVADRLEEQLAALDGLLASLRGRVAVGRGGMGGAGSAADLFSMEAERGRAADARRQAARETAAARYRLNELLGRPPDGPLPIGGAVPLRAPPGSADALADRARRENPGLLRARHRAAHAHVQQRRARLSWAPDLEFMIDEQRLEGGASGREWGVALAAPIWGGPAAENREARRHRAAARADLEAVENEIVRAVHEERAEAAVRLESVRAYEADILPASRSALALSLRQYEAGRMDFLRLLESLRTAIQTEVDSQGAIVEYARHWGMLEAAVGGPLEPMNEKE